MSTFNSFIPENCVGRKFRWTSFDIDPENSRKFEGVVTRCTDDAL